MADLPADVFFSDDWVRADAGNWGDPWATRGSLPFDTFTNQGRVVTDAVAAWAGGYSTAMDGAAEVTGTDVEFLVKVDRPALAYLNFILRGAGHSEGNWYPNNCYRVVILPNGQLELYRRESGVDTILDAYWTGIGAGMHWVRFIADGTQIGARVWLDGQAEPASWQVFANDGVHTDGFLAIGVGRDDETNATVLFQEVHAGVPTAVLPSASFFDDWGRADEVGWGAPWAVHGAGTFDTFEETGRIVASTTTEWAGGYGVAKVGGSEAVFEDTDLEVRFHHDGNTAYRSFVVRGSVHPGGTAWYPDNGYLITILDNNNIEMMRRVSGVNTWLHGDTELQPGEGWWRLRFQAAGNNIRFKLWADGTLEPSAWLFQVADSEVAGPGVVALSLGRDGANASTIRYGFVNVTVPSAAPGPGPQIPGVPWGQPFGKWQSTFQDTFPGTTLDSSKWVPGFIWGDETGSVSSTHPRLLYLPANVIVQDGKLILRGKIEATNTAHGERDFTSGIVTTGAFNTCDNGDFKFAQAYGYFEAKMKMPLGGGLWPAFWLLSGYDGFCVPLWPPEIDIVEFLGHAPEKYHAAYHWSHPPGNWEEAQAYGTDIPTVDLSEAYHVYGVEWTPQFIRWYFDGVPVTEFAQPANINNLPMYILLNLQIGGNFGGDIEPEQYPDYPDQFPADFEIDYVQVWVLDPTFGAMGDAGTLDFDLRVVNWRDDLLSPIDQFTFATWTRRWQGEDTISVRVSPTDPSVPYLQEGNQVQVRWRAREIDQWQEEFIALIEHEEYYLDTEDEYHAVQGRDIASRRIIEPPSHGAVQPSFEDDFNRDNDFTGWGPRWTLNGGGGIFTVFENQGFIETDGGFNAGRYAIAGGAFRDAELVTKFYYDGNPAFRNFALRGQGHTSGQWFPDTAYICQILPTNELQIKRRIDTVDDWVETWQLSLTTGVWYWLKFRAMGTDVAAKVWTDGAEEPESWLLFVEDTHVQNAGAVTVGLARDGTGDAIMRIDDFIASVPPYEEHQGPGETVMKAFIQSQVIAPLNPGRRIQFTVMEPDMGRGDVIPGRGRYDPLLIKMAELARASNLGWGWRGSAGRLEFYVIEGVDRSTNQDERPAVVISVDLDNVSRIGYQSSILQRATTAYVGGEGSGAGREVVTVHSVGTQVTTTTSLSALALGGGSRVVLPRAASVRSQSRVVMSGWAYLDSDNGASNVLFHEAINNNPGLFARFRAALPGRRLALTLRPASDGGQVGFQMASGNAIPLQTWVHWAVHVDLSAGQVRLGVHVPGGLSVVESFSIGTGQFHSTLSDGIWFGYRGDTGEHLNGRLADVRMWHTARSDAEIATARNAPLTNPDLIAGLFGNWRFDDAAGLQVRDYTARGHHGSIEGSNASWVDGPLIIEEESEKGPESFQRREHFVEARNAGSLAQLRDQGRAYLREQGPQARMEAELLPAALALYRTRFDVGDLVTIEHRGMRSHLRVMEVEVTLEPERPPFAKATFGAPWPDMPTLIERGIRRPNPVMQI